MAKILILSHLDLWRVEMTNKFVQAAHSMGYEVEVAYSKSSKERLDGGGIPELAKFRRGVEVTLEREIRDVDKISEKGVVEQELLTPNQLANRYCDGKIHYVPAMGKNSGSGKAVKAVVDSASPDYIVSLDTYAFVPKSVLKEHDVIGIHPSNLYEAEGLHTTVRTMIRNLAEGRQNVVIGSIHLLGAEVDSGVRIGAVNTMYDDNDSMFAVRMRVYQDCVRELTRMFMDDIDSYIALSRNHFKREEMDKIAPLTRESLNGYRSESHRLLIQGHERSEWSGKFEPVKKDTEIRELEVYRGEGIA